MIPPFVAQSLGHKACGHCLQELSCQDKSTIISSPILASQNFLLIEITVSKFAEL